MVAFRFRAFLSSGHEFSRHGRISKSHLPARCQNLHVYLGVSENEGYLILGAYNKDPTI